MNGERVPLPIEIRFEQTATIACRMQRFGLSVREQQIAWQYIAGVPELDIARALYIQVKTVKNHVSATLRKAGIGPLLGGGGRIRLYRALLGVPVVTDRKEAA